MGQMEDLKLYVQVVEQGSISKAASILRIAKSAVSRRISILEERYSSVLIDRTPGNWEITKDWHYKIDDTEYVIPAGFTFDGASIPKFLRTFFSPVGVLLMGGLVHDYGYKYATLLKKNKKDTIGTKDQAWMDKTFRDINIYVCLLYTSDAADE